VNHIQTNNNKQKQQTNNNNKQKQHCISNNTALATTLQFKRILDQYRDVSLSQRNCWTDQGLHHGHDEDVRGKVVTL
jgi:hypothetical protein